MAHPANSPSRTAILARMAPIPPSGSAPLVSADAIANSISCHRPWLVASDAIRSLETARGHIAARRSGGCVAWPSHSSSIMLAGSEVKRGAMRSLVLYLKEFARAHLTPVRYPPGLLHPRAPPVQSDQRALIKLAARLGPVFKQWAPGCHTTYIVGHRRARRFLAEHEDKISSISSDLAPIMPGGWIRQMRGETHRHYRRILLEAWCRQPPPATIRAGCQAGGGGGEAGGEGGGGGRGGGRGGREGRGGEGGGGGGGGGEGGKGGGKGGGEGGGGGGRRGGGEAKRR